MRIAIASDVSAQNAKQSVIARLTAIHDVRDVTPFVDSEGSSDYAELVALSVLRRDADRGIILSGRAVSASVAANRVPGIRAALCSDPYSAYLGAKNEGMNVLVFALHALDSQGAMEVIDAYLSAPLAPVEVGGGLSARRLQQVFAHVSQNIATQLSVAELAHVVGMSQYYFSKLFKASTGTTPHQYVMRQRVERAQQLLSETRTPVLNIAAQVGFETQSHFTSVFRRMLGTTPKRYREMQHAMLREREREDTVTAA